MPTTNGHKQIVYNDFTGGERGDIHPRYVAANQFHAKNMLLYRDGTLGPRPGLRKFLLAGADYKVGAVKATYAGIAETLGVDRIFYIQDKKFYAFVGGSPTSVDVTEFTGTMAASAPVNGPGILEQLEFNSYVTVRGDATYEADGLTNVLTALTDSPGGQTVLEYQDRLFVANVGDGNGASNRVFYSEHADFNDWPVLNFFDVGYAWPVSRFYKLNNGLLMSTQDNAWWLLQGSPETGSLRRLTIGSGPGTHNPRNAFVALGKVWFLTSTDVNTQPFPATFDGNSLDVGSFRHLRWIGTALGSNENIGGLWLPANNDMIFVGDKSHRSVIYNNGVWTFHQYQVDVDEHVAKFNDNFLVFTVDGDVSHKPEFYRSQIDLTRPGFTSDLWGGVGDGDDTPIDAFVEFREEWGDSGSHLRPKAIVVDFTSYLTGSTVPNHLTVHVRLLNRFGQPTGSTVPASWDESNETASVTSGTRRRFITRPEAVATSAGLQVVLSNIKGIKIESVVLDTEIVPGLDRY